MTRFRLLRFAVATIPLALWAYACGDGGTDPQPPATSEPASMTVTPSTVELTAVGATAQLTAEARDQNGQAITGAAITWMSGDASVADVSAGGLVTAAGNGSATITATAGSASGSATVTVAQVVASVRVSPAADTLAMGDAVRLSPAAADANGHVIPNAAFAWSSSDTMVARVDDSGLVRAVGEGMASVTVTSGGAEASATITVADLTRISLVAFYEATNGAGWIEDEGWLSHRPVGEWHGITTAENGRVTALALPASNLAGSLPPELGNLTSLEVLDLERNSLAGAIPSELGNLHRLRTLSLGVNRFTGPIPPELGRLASLEILRLRRNRLTGAIPSELSDLRNLTTLGVERNQLTGAIPLSLSALKRLTRLHFGENPGLCASGSADFVAWLASLEVYVGPLCNQFDRAGLVSVYEAAGGVNWTRSDGWLGDHALEDWYGVEADSLGRVTALDLFSNELAGRVPTAVGQLTRMARLKIDDNVDLAGSLPLSLRELSLEEFDYESTGLCAPPDPSFGEWLGTIPSHEGTGRECAPLSDREILSVLYHAAGGMNWVEAEDWASDRWIGGWSGVRIDRHGRVVSLSLSRNNLSGPIPPELAGLTSLSTLVLDSNDLNGPIPPELGKLSSLRVLILGSNDLTGPVPPELGNLTSLEVLILSSNDLTGPIPPELGDLSNLNTLWLGSNGLSGPIPPELGNLSSLGDLLLWRNGLTGPIPPELGDLSSLNSLGLSLNGLTGPIPPQLGNLADLRTLLLDRNDLTGPIPAELGNLSDLETLILDENDLSGPIPAELGRLSGLGTLGLRATALTGPIPSELGGLTNLRLLDLGGNDLTGSIPPEIGSLDQLVALRAVRNQLSGSVPPELGGLTDLRSLHLSGNARMSGDLPTNLTALDELDELLLSGTGLCAPVEASFQAWLSQVQLTRVRDCGADAGPAAYLTQAVQSLAYPVPLVAGKAALLRVFVAAPDATIQALPSARATFFLDGAQTYTIDLPGSSASIPAGIGEAESALDRSLNVEIPGATIQPGLEMVIDIDPAGALDPALRVMKRIPAEGRMPVRVEAMPELDLTFVPFLWAGGSDSSIVHLARAMAVDPQGHEMLSDTRTLLPVGDVNVTAHEPVLTSTTSVSALGLATRLVRVMEGGVGHYMGILPEAVLGGESGIASIGGADAFAVANSAVIAHELGHNFSLRHAPCGGAGGPDPAFPQVDGSIGAWGYDARGDGALIPPNTPDLMSYCRPTWIGDYGFFRAMSHRLAAAVGAPEVADAATRTILLWGGVDEHGRPFLEPAFLADAPPAVPVSSGAYELTGRDALGDELFSLSFDMPEMADSDGSSSFAFALPAGTDWAGTLETITLSGPGGSATLDPTTDTPVAIMRDSVSGQVRGILRNPSPAAMAREAATARTSMEVLTSRGIPREAEWRRE